MIVRRRSARLRAVFRLGFPLVLLALVSACPRGAVPNTVSTLEGLSLSLHRSPALQLAVDGAVFHKPALVWLELAAPVTTVNRGCFDDPPPILATVTLRQLDGNDERLPQTELKGLTLGSSRLQPMLAAVVKSDDCVVTLGADVLGPYAVSVTPGARRVSFAASGTRKALEQAAAGRGEAVVLEVTKDPRTDRPYLPVRVRQHEAELTGTFLLSTAERTSGVAPDAAELAGLQSQAAILAQVAKGAKVELPPGLAMVRSLAFDSFELAPGVGVNGGLLDPLDGWPTEGIIGRLGADVWSHFDAVFDLGAGAVLLSRPRLSVSGDVQRCERGGQSSEEACFELEGASGGDGVEAVATLWRSLPTGGRLYLDVASEGLTCRVGITFPPSDRGVSAQHLFPWEQVAKDFPACASALKRATSVKPGLFEESPLEACPGQCGFVEDVVSRKVSCECAAGSLDPVAEEKLGELYRLLLKEQAKRRDRELEPKDPE